MTNRQRVLAMCRELTPYGAGKKLGVSQLAAVCFGAGVGKPRKATIEAIERALARRKVKTASKPSRKVRK
jgi:hypothetical protein